MTTDGGGWTQLYDQDVARGYAPIAVWEAGLNIDEPNMGRYSILDLTGDFEGTSPGFEFFIDWPNNGGGFVRWMQSENPLIGRGAVSSISIVQSPTAQTGCTDFEGLGPDGDGSPTLNAFSLLDGTTTDCWWWAIGTSGPWSGGIPAYNDSDDGERLVAARTRLWVR
jgi:hypothetical protein